MTLKVLIIDDEPLIALDMEASMRAAGFEVVGLGRNADEAVAFIERGGIDVAILDANLRGESAEPVAERLRAAGIAFVAVSGYSSEQLGDWLGDAKLISKPYRDEQLVAEVRRIGDADAGDG